MEIEPKFIPIVDPAVATPAVTPTAPPKHTGLVNHGPINHRAGNVPKQADGTLD